MTDRGLLYKRRLKLHFDLLIKLVKMNFTKQSVTAINSERPNSGNKGIDVSICSEEERKLSWMGELRTRLFMQMGAEACWG